MARADFKILVEGKTANLEGIFFRIEVFPNFTANKVDVSDRFRMKSVNQSAIRFFQKSFLMNFY